MTDHVTRLAGALKEEERKLLACVHCGLCLEACPTYAHTGDENDGPRGRLYLMRAVEEERMPVTSLSFTRHINRCLGCRACESACPAGVEYGQLLEAARADISAHGRGRGFTARLLGLALRHVWAHPSRLRLAFRLARALRDAGVPRLALGAAMKRLLPARLVFAAALLDSSAPAPLVRDGEGATRSPEASTSSSSVKAATSPSRVSATSSSVNASVSPPGDVNGVGALLFEGCVGEGLFARVNRATARVLGANGCGTLAPEGQVCCGALHAHAGELEGARQLARRNVEAFGAGPPLPVVTNAGGCGAMLASYAQLLAHDAEYAARARDFSARVRDVSQQLAATGLREGAGVAGGAATYDASCHLLHGQRAATEPLRVLGAVRGLRLVPLAGSDVCCGGAGVYNLVEPELSARVLDEKLSHVAETGAHILATGNPGCHMQLGAGARLRGLPLRVCHPVELLDESYRRAGLYGPTGES